MKKIQQPTVEAVRPATPQAGAASLAPPQMAAQRRRAALMGNSPQTMQLKQLAQSMRGGAVVQLEPVAQLGPRNYGKTFKPQKNEMMTWLRDSALIGIDLGDDAEEAGSANEKVGWHHQYPYSELWERGGTYRYMADHGANLKLGPMKNRIGDPGDDIDVAYGKARRKNEHGPRDELEASYAPYSQQLINELTKPQTRTDNGRLLDNISMPVLDKSGKDKVFDSTDNKEQYWSEWYLSKNIRAELVSDDKIKSAITGLNKPAVTVHAAAITRRLNELLNGMQYSYATHTPALVDGTLASFRKQVVVETGIPSSKLNRKGPLREALQGAADLTYADLMHALLVDSKWISRGSQGEAHSIVEQYKEKMRTGNRELVWELLQLAALPHLELAVEAQYKKSVLRCLRKMDNEDALGAFFYPRVRELQRAAGDGELDPEAILDVVRQMPTVAPLQKTHFNEDEGAPLVRASSFVPDIDSETYCNEIANIYVNFIGGNRTKGRLGNGVQKTATIILQNHGLQRGEDEEDGKGVMFDWQGALVMSAAHIESALSTLLTGKKISGSELDMEEIGSFALAVHGALAGSGSEDYRQEPRIVQTPATVALDPETVRDYFVANYGNTGRIYARHLAAINDDPTRRASYCVGVDLALRMPGKGYASPALRYRTPRAISELGADASWNFTADQEAELRDAWHREEFRAFLAGYLKEAEVQALMLPHAPSV